MGSTLVIIPCQIQEKVLKFLVTRNFYLTNLQFKWYKMLLTHLNHLQPWPSYKKVPTNSPHQLLNQKRPNSRVQMVLRTTVLNFNAKIIKTTKCKAISFKNMTWNYYINQILVSIIKTKEVSIAQVAI